MTMAVYLLGAALLFVTFGMVRSSDRCAQNCGSCTLACRGTKENHDG